MRSRLFWLLGLKMPYVTPPEHLFFFNRVTIRRLMSDSRLQIGHLSTWGELRLEEAVRGLAKILPTLREREGSGTLWFFGSLGLALSAPVRWLLDRAERGIELKLYCTRTEAGGR